MKNSAFESLIQSYITTKIGVTAEFISPTLLNTLRAYLLQLKHLEVLKSAGIGDSYSLQQDKSVRSDAIHWLDRKNNHVVENAFLQQVEDFIVYLNMECYAGIQAYEFHYAYYSPGAYYEKHFDQFSTNSDRHFSMVTYLNPFWKSMDGGELKVYLPNEEVVMIAPEMGKTILFKSNELAHEVLPTSVERLSITGWLKV
jgi:SM-20-related protein